MSQITQATKRARDKPFDNADFKNIVIGSL